MNHSTTKISEIVADMLHFGRDDNANPHAENKWAGYCVRLRFPQTDEEADALGMSIHTLFSSGTLSEGNRFMCGYEENEGGGHRREIGAVIFPDFNAPFTRPACDYSRVERRVREALTRQGVFSSDVAAFELVVFPDASKRLVDELDGCARRADTRAEVVSFDWGREGDLEYMAAALEGVELKIMVLVQPVPLVKKRPIMWRDAHMLARKGYVVHGDRRWFLTENNGEVSLFSSDHEYGCVDDHCAGIPRAARTLERIPSVVRVLLGEGKLSELAARAICQMAAHGWRHDFRAPAPDAD